MKVGLTAHNSKKRLMQDLCIAYKGILSKHNLYATSTTGMLIENVTNLHIRKFLPGYLGGMQQMVAQISNNEMDMVIFLRNPEYADPHEPNINELVKICDRYNIPIATNLATAELLILALGNGDLEWRES